MTRQIAAIGYAQAETTDEGVQESFLSSKDTLAVAESHGRKEFFRHRGCWSRAIIVWISVLIFFNVIVTLLVGCGWLNYKNYQWFIMSVMAESFLQIVGLGFVAVRFLFSEKR